MFLIILITLFSNFDISTDDKEILAKYEKAISSINTIEYSFYAVKEKDIMLGDAKLKKGKNYNENQYLFIGSVIRSNGHHAVSFSDNNEAFHFSGKDGKIQEFNDFKFMMFQAGVDVVHLVVNGIFSDNSAYGVIKKGDTFKVDGSEVIEGIDCYIANIIKEDGSNEKIYIGKNDFLPRRLKTSSIDIQFTIKSANKEIPNADFNLNEVLGQKILKGGVLAVGEKSPQFSLKNLKNETVSTDKLAGKITVLDFWGTWCKPCIDAIPELNELYTYLKKLDVNFYGISCYEKIGTKKLSDFVDQKGIKYPILTEGEKVSQEFGVIGFSTMVVLDKNGNVLLTKGSDGSHDAISYQEIGEKIKVFIENN